MDEEYNLVWRYLFLIAMGFSIQFFYSVFRPLTFYPVYAFFKLFGYGPTILEGSIHIGCQELVFVNACIAASAYYLFLVLVVSTKGLSIKEMAKIWGIGVAAILIMNVLRIIFISLVLIHFEEHLFEAWHMLMWRFVATVYIAGLWIYLSRRFAIQNIPIYSDFKDLLNKSFLKKNR